MENRELPDEVKNASRHVAVVLTQGWCPQWTMMKRYLEGMKKEATELDLTVFTLIYDGVDYFDEFRDFKEAVWQNYQIPYVRYYTEGTLVAESNYVPARRFLGQFADGSS